METPANSIHDPCKPIASLFYTEVVGGSNPSSPTGLTSKTAIRDTVFDTVLPETWATVAGTTSAYFVSDLGRVRNSSGKILKSFPTKKGYIRVDLDGKKRRVHVLVALAFIGPRPDGCEVNHIDGVKANCQVTNLEYLTPTANKAHASRMGLLPSGEKNGNARLTQNQVSEILELRSRGFSMKKIAIRFGVCEATIYKITSGKTWRSRPIGQIVTNRCWKEVGVQS